MKSKKSSGKGMKPAGKRAVKDLPARKDRGVKGGWTMTLQATLLKADADTKAHIMNKLG